MRTCEEYQELISAMLDGELTAGEKAELEAHIAVCGECRAMYEAFAAVSAMETAEVPDTLHEKVMTKVSAAQKAFRTQRMIVRMRPMLTAAACLVVVVGTVFALRTGFARRGASSETPMAIPAAAEGAADMAAPRMTMKAAPDTVMIEEETPMEPAAAPAFAETEAAAAEEDEYAYVGGAAPAAPMPEPKEKELPAADAGAPCAVVEIAEQMPYDAFSGFIVVDTETDTVWELRLTEDTRMTDEVRSALTPGSVVTVEYHTEETDERPVIYADAIFFAE